MESTAQWWATSLENSGTFTRSSSIPLLSSVSVVGGGRPRGFYPLHCTFESCHGFRACNCAFVDRAGWYGGVLQRRPKLVRFQLSTPPISDRLLDRWPSGLWSRFAKPASEKIRPSVRIALYPPLTLCKLIGERLRLVVPFAGVAQRMSARLRTSFMRVRVLPSALVRKEAFESPSVG